MEPVIGAVNKGGECWLDLSIDRRSKGIELWVRADPRVEEFIKSLAEGETTEDPIESFGKGWIAVDKPLTVYRMNREIDTTSYALNHVCGTMTTVRGAGPNIAFLRIVGVGSPEGIRFAVNGPISRDYIRSIKENILTATRQLFKDYVVPVHINLRVTSTEL